MRPPNPKVDPDSPAARIAAKFDKKGRPRASALAKAIKRTPSTVQRWLEKGSIDAAYHGEIVTAGRELKIPIKENDFVDSRVFEKRAAAPAGEALPA